MRTIINLYGFLAVACLALTACGESYVYNPKTRENPATINAFARAESEEEFLFVPKRSVTATLDKINYKLVQDYSSLQKLSPGKNTLTFDLQVINIGNTTQAYGQRDITISAEPGEKYTFGVYESPNIDQGLWIKDSTGKRVAGIQFGVTRNGSPLR